MFQNTQDEINLVVIDLYPLNSHNLMFTILITPYLLLCVFLYVFVSYDPLPPSLLLETKPPSSLGHRRVSYHDIIDVSHIADK